MIHHGVADSPALHALDGRVEAPPKARSYWQTVGYRLRHDALTLCFGGVVLLIMLSALGAPRWTYGCDTSTRRSLMSALSQPPVAPKASRTTRDRGGPAQPLLMVNNLRK